MINKYIFLTFCLLFFYKYCNSQNVLIEPSGITPKQQSYPRLSYKSILALNSTSKGDLAYDTTFNCLRFFNGEDWLCSYQNPSGLQDEMAILSTFGSVGNDAGISIAVDSLGNIYQIGSFQGTVNFGGISRSSIGSTDYFLGKYDPNGTIKWVKTLNGASNYLISKVIVDESNFIYISGYFSGNVDLEGVTLNSLGSFDNFLAKYDTHGTLIWVKTYGGNQDDRGKDHAFDKNGNFYVTGEFNDTYDFYGISKTSAGGKDLFLMKYSPSNSVGWVQTFGGVNDESGSSVALDYLGNVYISGNKRFFQSNFSLPYQSYDIFTNKYTTTGTFVNSITIVDSIGGNISISPYSKITIDELNNLIVTGCFQGNVNFGTISKTTNGYEDIFLSKYNSNGVLQWVQTFGGSQFDYSKAITVDKNGSIYLVGGEDADFYLYESLRFFRTGYSSFFSEYDKNGNLKRIRRSERNGFEFNEVVGDGNNNVYVTGNITGLAKFNGLRRTSNGLKDLFLFLIREYL